MESFKATFTTLWTWPSNFYEGCVNQNQTNHVAPLWRLISDVASNDESLAMLPSTEQAWAEI